MAAATTSGPAMPVGHMIRWSSLPSAPSGRWNCPVIGVSMDPGHTALTRRPCLAYSTARVFVRASTPPLDDAYAAAHGWPNCDDVEDTLTMAPPPSSRAGMAA